MRPVILLTDFGRQDPYVGQLEAAIWRVDSGIRVIHWTHEVLPQAVPQAAFLLAATWNDIPNRAIVCAVVDPGVGGERPTIAAELEDGRVIVGPDNGVFSFFDAQPGEESASAPQGRTSRFSKVGGGIQRAVRLDNPVYWGPRDSRTFHARDRFVPVAAHLSAGVDLDLIGSPIDLNAETAPLRIDGVDPVPRQHGLSGRVLHIDRYGNLITNLPFELPTHAPKVDSTNTEEAQIEAGWSVRLAPSGEGSAPPSLPLRPTYEAVEPGQPVAYVGSAGTIEIAINRDAAARVFQVGIGHPVTLERSDS